MHKILLITIAVVHQMNDFSDLCCQRLSSASSKRIQEPWPFYRYFASSVQNQEEFLLWVDFLAWNFQYRDSSKSTTFIFFLWKDISEITKQVGKRFRIEVS